MVEILEATVAFRLIVKPMSTVSVRVLRVLGVSKLQANVVVFRQTALLPAAASTEATSKLGEPASSSQGAKEKEAAGWRWLRISREILGGSVSVEKLTY